MAKYHHAMPRGERLRSTPGTGSTAGEGKPAQFSSLMVRRSVGPLLDRNQEYSQVFPFVIKR